MSKPHVSPTANVGMVCDGTERFIQAVRMSSRCNAILAYRFFRSGPVLLFKAIESGMSNAIRLGHYYVF